MTKELKDMNREEIAELFGEKQEELKELIEKINKETDYETYIFSVIGVSEKGNDNDYASGDLVIGNVFDLANLLANSEGYEEISKVIILDQLKGLFSEGEDETT
ncbi:DUF2482 family protein [Staphylococcus warneri]|uniref:DUF2482 family protein n=1 Tax=Staphylococcus warneri TaxID=1292 RepID=UPI0003175648|nr:DUF2482 family protein [Staphylococcus warneri]